MAILPQATMTLGIVTAIAVFAVLLAQQHRWGFHLAAAMLVYAVYHLFWIASMGLTLPLSGSLGVFTVGSAMTVYFLSALSSFREEYAEGRQEVGGVVTHLAAWGALAAVYMLHLAETDLLGPVFLVSGLVAFALSINARQREISWLRDADVLIAQAFILGSLLTWRALFGPPLAFSGLIFLETLLFLRVVINDGARPAVLVGTIVAAIASLLFIAFGVDTLVNPGDAVGTWQLATLMVAGAAVPTKSWFM